MDFYKTLIAWCKDYGLEQWSWVAGVLTLAGSTVAWLWRKLCRKQPAEALCTTPTNNMSSHVSSAGSAQTAVVNSMTGTGHVGVQNNNVSPEHLQYLTDQLVQKSVENGALGKENESLKAELQALQLQAVTHIAQQATSPDATEAMKAAYAALEQGDSAKALALLLEQEQAAIREAHPHRLLAARLAREQGALWVGKSVERAYEAFERAHGHDPEDLPTLGYLVELAKGCRTLEKANAWAQKAFGISEKRVTSDPKNTQWQRDLSVSFNDVARLYEAQGRREEALVSYQKALAIAERLAASDPKNMEWQRDLSVSLNKVAGIYEAQGKREEAIGLYQQALTIRERLAESDPKNMEWQRDLSVSFNNVAGIYEAQGKREEAIGLYKKFLDIVEPQAASDALNSDWQRGLFCCLNNMVRVYATQGKLNEAFSLCQKSLAIAKQLIASDPKNMEWQRDLSVSFNNVAGICAVQGKREEALALYQKALTLREQLAASDPKNAQWQVDLAGICYNMARIDGQKKSVRMALFGRALEVFQALHKERRLTVQQIEWIKIVEDGLAQVQRLPA